MSKISAIRVDNTLIKLLPHDEDYYGEFFDIDSVSLLLGKNGSGKTRMLMTIASSIVTNQDDSFQFYFQNTPNGHIEPMAPYNKYLCTVYYSALPYKRYIPYTRGVFDASPGRIRTTDSRRLEKFGEIAEILNINTQLTGFLGYSRKIFRALLIPVLRNANELSSGYLQSIVSEFKMLEENIKNSIQFDYKASDKQRENLLIKIEENLENELEQRLGAENCLLFLSSLEYLNSKNKDFAKYASTELLYTTGIIQNDSSSSEFLQYEKFKQLDGIVENTKLILSEYCQDVVSRERRTFTFKIKSIEITNIIRGLDTPIIIEWLNQSSGLQALVDQFTLIDEAIGNACRRKFKSVLLLIDEGDAFLHLEWQRRYISILNKFLGSLKYKYQLDNLQLIIASHSPLLAADLPGDFVTNLDSNEPINSFAAPMEVVISEAFFSNSLGEFAARKINEIHKRAIEGQLTRSDKNVVEAIGDISIKSALKRSFSDDY